MFWPREPGPYKNGGTSQDFLDPERGNRWVNWLAGGQGMGTAAGNKQLPDAERKVRRIGIHGTRNAGKTCYLGCLYGQRIGPDVQIAFRHDEGLHYLKNVWADLSQQRTPAFTAMGLPSYLSLEVENPRARLIRPLMLCDFAGELLQPLSPGASSMARELKPEIKKWLRSCHAVLLFLDSSQPNLEQLDAIGALLIELRRDGRGAGLERPLGMVLTKWDTQGPISEDFLHEKQRALAFLETHPVFKQLAQQLRESGDRVEVFPVSAFGNQARANKPPPPGQLRPCHIHTPLAWAAEAADQVLLEQTRQEAQQHLRKRPRLLDLPLLAHADYPAAIGVCRKLLNDYGITAGPLVDAAARDVSRLRLRGSLQKAGYAVRVAALALAALAAGILYGRHEEEQEYAQVALYRLEHRGPEEIGNRLDRERQFLASWGSFLLPGRRQAVMEWSLLDAASAKERGQEFAAAVALYRQFLKQFPGSPHRVDVEGYILNLLSIIEDQQEYDRLRTLAQRDGEVATLQETDGRARAYLNSTRDVKHMTKEVEAWRGWFDGLKEQRNYFIVIQSISIPAGSALNAGPGTEPRVVIHLDVGLESPRCQYPTDWYTGTVVKTDARLGPFPFRWGEPGTLKVFVQGYHPIGSFDQAPQGPGESLQWLRDERFVFGKANGRVVLTCAKGKQISVTLCCPEALPPELPPYR